MAIARMTKVSIALHSSHKEDLLKHLQDESALHITKIEEKEEVKENEASDDKQIRLLETRLSHLDDTIRFLRNFMSQGGFLSGLIPQKLPVSETKFTDIVGKFDFEDVIEQIKEIDLHLSKLKSEKEHLISQEEIIESWLDLSIPVELLKSTATTIVLPGTVNKRLFGEEIRKKAEELGVQTEKIGESKDELYLVILFHKSDENQARNLLDDINFITEDFRGFKGIPSDIYQNIQNRIQKIEEEIEALLEKGKEFVDFYENLLMVYDHTMDEITRFNAIKDAVRTKTAYIIQGWVEAKRMETLQKSINSYDAATMIEIEPGKEEKPPVKLINRKFFKPFEIVTQLYGTPRYNEVDPSPLLALFFALFFGLCITDAGYGIVLALIALFLMKKMPEARKFLWLIFIGALFTIVVGALLGGWFGNLFNGTILEKPTKAIVVFDPMKSYFVFFRLAILLGGIQIFWGLIIKLSEDIKDKRFVDAFFEEIVWITILISLLFMLFSTDFCIQLNLTPKRLLPQSFFLPSIAVFGLCAVLVILFGAREEKNPVFRLLIGVLRLFILGGIFSYIGDFLSYIRLMALGLVTAGIANAINDIAKMTLGIPIVGIVIFIIVLVVGHLFNIGINTLGAFVHTLRLQYVEFFQKFFTGGGKAFNPLRKNEKYVIIREI